MMKSKKSFKELAKQISALQEDQLGKLKGGFTAFSAKSLAMMPDDNTNNNNNSVAGDPCSCSCTCSCSEEL